MANVSLGFKILFHFGRICPFIDKLFLGGFTGLPDSPTFLHTKDFLIKYVKKYVRKKFE